jgi:hypothetical protein
MQPDLMASKIQQDAVAREQNARRKAAVITFEAMWKRFWETLNNWELWPFELRYLFISPVWLWYCLRSRSFWFFTPSNPTITFGGFENETKQEMYSQLPEALCPKTLYVGPGEPFDALTKRLAIASFSYPFCTKPDVGMKGLLFRKIDSESDFLEYHRQMPVAYMVQELIDLPLEVSVFYYRYPHQQKGTISGFIQKEVMDVTGDGKKTLWQLIQEHPKARYREEEMRTRHAAHLETILPQHQRYPLAYAANLNRGARFISLSHLIDERLLNVFDELSHDTRFYYGRYDIKCRSIEDLKEGKHFIILEFNGSGAEPNHVYNQGASLFAAQAVFLQHWKALYQISRYNYRQGIRYWPFRKGLRFMKESKKHLRLLEALDTKILV